MDKIRRKLNNLSIPSTFVLLAGAFLLIAMLLVEIEKTLLMNAQQEIAFQYSEIVEGFNSEKVWGNQSVFRLSGHDGNMMYLYEMLSWLLPPLTYLICFISAGLVFYRVKIKKPLSLLSAASRRIADHDLNFSVSYDKDDEMGTLCSAFEKMRSALEDNNRGMWRQMNERKRLNAAFSHDLRTPLTVLEGHLGILQKYAPEGKLSADDIMEAYAVMAGQISRLKNYVSSMNTLQRLEDMPIERKAMPAADLIMMLNDTASIYCKGKQLLFLNKVTAAELTVDPDIVAQVFENLLSNAVQYAENVISIQYTSDNDAFSIIVTDDGKGFDDSALKSATTPFYTAEKKTDDVHLGLGLNICKVLCERHNGSIILSNSTAGRGASVNVRFGKSKFSSEEGDHYAKD